MTDVTIDAVDVADVEVVTNVTGSVEDDTDVSDNGFDAVAFDVQFLPEADVSDTVHDVVG